MATTPKFPENRQTRLSNMKKLGMFAIRFNLLAKSVAQMGAVVLILTGEPEVSGTKNVGDPWRAKWGARNDTITRSSCRCERLPAAHPPRVPNRPPRLQMKPAPCTAWLLPRVTVWGFIAATQQQTPKRLINTMKRISQAKWKANGGHPKGNRR